MLVVDDEPDVLTLCEVNLQLDGFEILTAADGLDALEKVRAERPDVVLLDVKLPGLDGFAVLERLQRDPDTSAIPVILLTAYTMPADQIRGWQSGAADYLTKPFNPTALLDAVRRALADEAPGHARRIELAKLAVERKLGAKVR